MPLLLSIFVAMVLWIVTWALGLKGFDGFLLALLIVLGTATVQMMLPYLPGRKAAAADDN